MGIQKEMKKFYKDQPVAALVIGGYFAFGVALPLFGYSFLGTKVLEYDPKGMKGYQTW